VPATCVSVHNCPLTLLYMPACHYVHPIRGVHVTPQQHLRHDTKPVSHMAVQLASDRDVISSRLCTDPCLSRTGQGGTRRQQRITPCPLRGQGPLQGVTRGTCTNATGDQHWYPVTDRNELGQISLIHLHDARHDAHPVTLYHFHTSIRRQTVACPLPLTKCGLYTVQRLYK